MVDLITAVWAPQFHDFGGQDLQTKAGRLIAAARGAYGAMDAFSTRMNMHAPTMLFVAPEYYFVEDADFGLLDTHRRTTVESIVRVLSGQMHNMIIVPGSINYWAEAGMFAPMLAKRSGVRPLIAQSYCPVYVNGGLLNRYYKRMNDRTYDNAHPEHEAYFLGGNKPANFEFNGIRFGVDICGDYAQNRLVGDVGVGGVDVHIVTSGTLQNNYTAESIAAHDGGYLVHSDSADSPRSNAQKNGVWMVRRGGGMHPLTGKSLPGALSPEVLSDPKWGDVPIEDRRTRVIASYGQQLARDVEKNVTKMTDLKAHIAGFTNIKIYSTPV